MPAETHSQIASFIWSICNLLRGPYGAEWSAAFGAITDESFIAPVRGATRQVGTLDAN